MGQRVTGRNRLIYARRPASVEANRR